MGRLRHDAQEPAGAAHACSGGLPVVFAALLQLPAIFAVALVAWDSFTPGNVAAPAGPVGKVVGNAKGDADANGDANANGAEAIDSPGAARRFALEASILPGVFPYDALLPAARAELLRIGALGAVAPGFGRPSVACAQTVEFARVWMCVFSHREPMNDALLRASFLVENGEVVAAGAARAHPGYPTTIGHDLREDDLADAARALDTWSARAPESSKGGAARGARIEREFWNGALAILFPPVHRGATSLTPRPGRDEGILLAGALGADLEATFHHEILHAAHFRLPSLRRAVADFWRDFVSEEHKTAITARLQASSYAVAPRAGDAAATVARRKELLLGEFFAYVAMEDSSTGLLARWAETYRPALLSVAARAGLPPLGGDGRMPRDAGAGTTGGTR